MLYPKIEIEGEGAGLCEILMFRLLSVSVFDFAFQMILRDEEQHKEKLMELEDQNQIEEEPEPEDTNFSFTSSFKKEESENVRPLGKHIVRLLPDYSGMYHLPGDLGNIQEIISLDELNRFLKGLNGIRFGKLYYVSYVCFACLVISSFAAIAFAFRSNSAHSLLVLLFAAVIYAIWIVIYERFLESRERQNLISYLHKYTISFGRSLLFYTEEIQFSEESITEEGYSNLIGSFRVCIQIAMD
jgi:hypothetical protein